MGDVRGALIFRVDTDDTNDTEEGEENVVLPAQTEEIGWSRIRIFLILISFMFFASFILSTKILFEKETISTNAKEDGRKITYNYSQYICPTGNYIEIAKKRLFDILKEESPEYNVSKWSCPQGMRGLTAPIPSSLDHVQLNLNRMWSRCDAFVCDMDSNIHAAHRILTEKAPVDRIDYSMMLGPFPWEHPYQLDYCQRKISNMCSKAHPIPPCDILEELVDYGNSLVRVPCRKEALMGAYGPASPLTPLYCDAYLAQHNK
jgi:hypothetical protein